MTDDTRKPVEELPPCPECAVMEAILPDGADDWERVHTAVFKAMAVGMDVDDMLEVVNQARVDHLNCMVAELKGQP